MIGLSVGKSVCCCQTASHRNYIGTVWWVHLPPIKRLRRLPGSPHAEVISVQSTNYSVCTIHKDQGIFEATNRGTVAKGNVEMNDVKIPRTHTVNQLFMWSFWYGDVSSKLNWKLHCQCTCHLWQPRWGVYNSKKQWHPVMWCISSSIQWDFVSEALGVSHGWIGGNNNPGWWRCVTFMSFDIDTKGSGVRVDACVGFLRVYSCWMRASQSKSFNLIE
jgi:hypothetical protein